VKAIRVHAFGGPEALRLEEAPDPRPGPGQVVIQVEAAGVNPVDVYIRSGTYARKPALPYTPGFDAAGVVEETGPGVTGLRPGDRVWAGWVASGAYAERALCDAPNVHPLPEEVSFSQGAAIHVPYATAYRALFQRAGARPPETVLVHGASGGVGIAALQWARAAGMTVLGTAGSKPGRNLVAAQGAEVFDHGEAGYLERVLAHTRGRGVDVILEMLANVNLAGDLKILAPGGRVVVIGSRGTVAIDPRDAMSRDAAILGMVLFNVPERDAAGIHAAIGAGLESGVLRPVVARELPLQEAARAHALVLEPGAAGKIILRP
jgi:NADPH2:quinone reductase